MGITIRTAEFRDQNGRVERSVRTLRIRVDVKISSRVQRSKVESYDSCVGIHEDGWVGVEARGIHSLTQIQRLLPAEIVACILAEGGINIGGITETPESSTVKEEPVPIR